VPRRPVVVLHYGLVLTLMVAPAAHASARTVDAVGPVVTPTSFGVGRAFAVLVAVFGSMLALMVLGGHIRAKRQRNRRGSRSLTESS
jgi:hypothetical protein